MSDTVAVQDSLISSLKEHHLFKSKKKKNTADLKLWMEVYVIPAEKTHIAGHQHLFLLRMPVPAWYACAPTSLLKQLNQQD